MCKCAFSPPPPLPPSDSAQSKGIVFLLDLRECSQDTKYFRQLISVLLNGYPLMLKMVFVIGAPMWVKPILKSFRQLHKVPTLHSMPGLPGPESVIVSWLWLFSHVHREVVF